MDKILLKYLAKPITIIAYPIIIMFFVFDIIGLYEKYDVKINGKQAKVKVIEKDAELKFGVGVLVDEIYVKYGTVFQDIYYEINYGDSISIRHFGKHNDTIYIENGDNSIHRNFANIIYLIILIMLHSFVLFRLFRNKT